MSSRHTGSGNFSIFWYTSVSFFCDLVAALIAEFNVFWVSFPEPRDKLDETGLLVLDGIGFTFTAILFLIVKRKKLI
jgi:hypothetical protein